MTLREPDSSLSLGVRLTPLVGCASLPWATPDVCPLTRWTTTKKQWPPVFKSLCSLLQVDLLSLQGCWMSRKSAQAQQESMLRSPG